MIPLLAIPADAKAVFRKRPNRFAAIVDIEFPASEKDVYVHVHDPGRLEELLFQGNRLLLKQAKNKNRKTLWDVIAADSPGGWTLMHSGYHRRIAEKILQDARISPFGKAARIKAEVRYHNSRIDFLITGENGNKTWIETKGCTLSENGVAKFPDAPTIRGTRHVRELTDIVKQGKDAAVMVFLVTQTDAERFEPKADTDPEFAKAYYEALKAGVKAFALKLSYQGGIVTYVGKIPVAEE